MIPRRRASREAHLESSAALASGVDPRDARRASRRVALELLARDPELARVAQVSPSSFVRAARKAGVQEADANDSELIRDIAEVADRYARATGVGGKIPTSTGGVGGRRGAPGPRKPRGIPDGLDPRGGGGLRGYLGGGGLGRGGDGGLGGWDRTAKYLPGANDGRGALIDLAPPDRNVRSIIGPGDAGDLDERIDGVLDALGLPPQRRNRSAVDEGQSRKRNVGEAQLPMGAWNRVNPGESVSEDPDSGTGSAGGTGKAQGTTGGASSGSGGSVWIEPDDPNAPSLFSVLGEAGSSSEPGAGEATLTVAGTGIGMLVGMGVGAVLFPGPLKGLGMVAGILGGGLLGHDKGRDAGRWLDRKHRPADDGSGPVDPRSATARGMRTSNEALPADDGTSPTGPRLLVGRSARLSALRGDYRPAPDDTGPVGPWSHLGRYGKPAPDDPDPGGPTGLSSALRR